MKTKTDLSYINSLDDLKSEQFALKQRIRIQEALLKDHFQRVPKEALKLGASTLVPNVLEGRATTSIFRAATSIMGSVFAKKGEKGAVLWKGVQQAGFYFLAKQALKLFAKKF